MATLRSCVLIDPQVHERWTKFKERISDQFFYNQNTVGLAVVLALMMDHWEKSPPDPDWLKTQLELYPKRGRPRRSAPASMAPRVALKKSQTGGHELFTGGTLAGRWNACKNCDALAELQDWTKGIPAYNCPAVDPTVSAYKRHRYTRKELIDRWKFDLDELSWLPEDPPNP